MSLADLLAHGKGDSKGAPMSEDDGDDMGGDSHAMAEASVKAFFEAGEKGDFAEAAMQLSSAIEHCKAYGDDGDEPDGHAALMLIPHKK